MTSYSGYINYVEYVAGSNKGAIKQGDLFNSPFGLGKVDPNYTSSKVVEAIDTVGGTVDYRFAWTPSASKAVKAYVNGAWVEVAAALCVIENDKVVGIKKDAFADGTKIAYEYDNEVVPQNDLPTIKAQMKTMPLVAKARHIAIYFSQFAAFQAKTDYGFDLGDQLAEKAVGQLSYEIDSEVVQLLADNAELDNTLRFNIAQRVGETMFERYEAFAKVIADATRIIYDRTKRFAPTYMLIASDVLPVVQFCKGFTAAPVGAINGPYMCGTIGGIKVYVSPALEAGKFVFGVNGSDMASSAAVYAPYMPIVPTQLLGFADGNMTQGWSTLYDLKILNKNLLVAGKIYEDFTEIKNTGLNIKTLA